MFSCLASSLVRRLLFASLLLAAPLAMEAQSATLANQTSVGRLPLADLTPDGDELASGASRLLKQAAPELTISTLTAIGAMAASGAVLRRKRQI